MAVDPQGRQSVGAHDIAIERGGLGFALDLNACRLWRQRGAGACGVERFPLLGRMEKPPKFPRGRRLRHVQKEKRCDEHVLHVLPLRSANVIRSISHLPRRLGAAATCATMAERWTEHFRTE